MNKPCAFNRRGIASSRRNLSLQKRFPSTQRRRCIRAPGRSEDSLLKVKNIVDLAVAAGARRAAGLQCLTKLMICRQFRNHLQG